MALSDPLGDLLTRIRNAQRQGIHTITSPASQLRANVLEVLKREGYIRDYAVSDVRAGVRELRVELKYHEGSPVIRQIARVSKPGRRVYSAISDLKPIKNGLGISILSTSKGVMSDTAAREAKVGGEVLCRVY